MTTNDTKAEFEHFEPKEDIKILTLTKPLKEGVGKDLGKFHLEVEETDRVDHEIIVFPYHDIDRVDFQAMVIEQNGNILTCRFLLPDMSSLYELPIGFKLPIPKLDW
jgi:hypothetical protein